jgi:hypothetical protein
VSIASSSGGSHWIWSTPGTLLVQYVDARRQQVPIGPVEGWSADKWRVRIWLVVDVAVSDPIAVATHREPLQSLSSAVRSATLRYIEQHSHAALTGAEGDRGGLDAPSDTVLERLRSDPALTGLEIIAVRVVDRQGDERQIEAATTATVAAAQIDEGLRVDAARYRSRLQELQSQSTISDQEHHLRMAALAAESREGLLRQQAEVQRASLAARLEVVFAQIQAQVNEIAHDEQLWQAEQERFQVEWERLQEQQREAHQVDQQLRMFDAQQGIAREAGELSLAAQERQNAQLLALTELQERLMLQRDQRAQTIAERREQHEQALLNLQLRHDRLLAEQMQQLEQWRRGQDRQHDRQLTGIAGAARIAAAAATQSRSEDDTRDLADAGLRMIQELAE